MTKLHGKSVLLGMGIGTILTALLGLIFFLGYKPEMDEAKVRELARKYGMVDPQERSNMVHKGSMIIEIKEEDTLTDITERLVNAGLVKDSFSFQIKVINQKVKDGIIPGFYEFQGNESDQGIIDILTAASD